MVYAYYGESFRLLNGLLRESAAICNGPMRTRSACLSVTCVRNGKCICATYRDFFSKTRIPITICCQSYNKIEKSISGHVLERFCSEKVKKKTPILVKLIASLSTKNLKNYFVEGWGSRIQLQFFGLSNNYYFNIQSYI